MPPVAYLSLKRQKALILAALTSVLVLCPLIAHAKINVVATLPDLGSLAREIGKDKVDVGTFWSYVVVEGPAELSAVAAALDDPTVEELIEIYRAIGGEHPDWDDYRRAMVADQRLVIRLRPNRAYGLLR